MANLKALVRETGQVRNLVPNTTDVLEVSDIDYAGAMVLGANATAISIGVAAMTTTIEGDLTVDGITTLTGTASMDGDVDLGDGSGDTITIGGGGDTVNLGQSGDTVNLGSDLEVAAGVMLDLIGAGGYINLPTNSQATATDNTDGILRYNTTSDEIQYLNDTSNTWVSLGTATGNSLQQAYVVGNTITVAIAEGNLGVEVTDELTNGGGFEITHDGGAGTWYWDESGDGPTLMDCIASLNRFTLDAIFSVGQTTPAASVQDYTTLQLDTSSTFDVNATGAATIDSTGGAISIGAGADAQAINLGTGAAARTISVGNTTGATAVNLDAGTGGISLDAGGASNFATSAGALTLTSAAAATWSTAGGALTLQGATDLALDAAGGEITFDDSYRAGGTYANPMPFADAQAEWDTFEVNFGEVSLLNAVNQCATGSGVYTSWDAQPDEDIVAGQPVTAYNTGTNGILSVADANDANKKYGLCGVAVVGATTLSGDDARIATTGVVSITSNASETWSAGDAVYLDTNAGCGTTTAPSSSGDIVQRIGWATGDPGAATSHQIILSIGEPTLV